MVVVPKMGDHLEIYNVVLDRFQAGVVVHVHDNDVALILLDEKRKDGGNWYAMSLLNPPKEVQQGVRISGPT